MNLEKLNNLIHELSQESCSYLFPGLLKKDIIIWSHDKIRSWYSRKMDILESVSMPCISEEYDAFEMPEFAKEPASVVKEAEPEPDVIDLPPDERTKAILKEISAIQEKYGITIEELEVLLECPVKPSELIVSHNGKIILPDFDLEVKMDTLTKAVFLLYLRHPDGIRYKDLSDHRKELESIYLRLSGRDNLEAIAKSLDDLCDPFKNSINEKVSRIKKAFRDVMDDRIARLYYVDGEKGTAKRVMLDRNLVIWDL